MNWYQIFYLFSIVDNLGTFFGWMVTIFTLITVISWIVFIIYKGYANGVFSDSREKKEEDEENKRDLAIQRRWVWFSTIFFVVFWLLYIATPTKKDMLLIIAGGAVGEFVASDSSAQKLPADITRFLHAEIVKATAEIGEDDGDTEKKSVVSPEVERIKKMSKEELERILIKEVGINPSILRDSTTSK